VQVAGTNVMTQPSLSLQIYDTDRPLVGRHTKHVRLRHTPLAGFPRGTAWLTRGFGPRTLGGGLWVFPKPYKIVVTALGNKDNLALAKEVAAYVGRHFP